VPVKKRIALVSGHLGFVGRHMVTALEAAGYWVTGVELPYDARRYFQESSKRYDLVVHAAAVVGGRAKIDGAPLALAVNLELDAALFQWAARTRPGRVIYLSSSAAYPVALQHADGHPLAERAITLGGPIVGTPDSLYGWCKLTGETLASLARAAGVPVSVVRPFSGYGSDQSEDYPFPSFARRARERQDPFVIWGDGEQVRDWIHIDDVCAAILAMAREGIDRPVNLGTGRGVSMRELAALMCAAAGYEPELKLMPEMPAGVAYRVADVRALREFYEPEVSLEEGVKRAVRA
jgi:nucleoside-diphosphate-sugar epimerase